MRDKTPKLRTNRKLKFISFVFDACEIRLKLTKFDFLTFFHEYVEIDTRG